nr:immunoglobulin heavy chain junction region [Homo sapiens]
SSNEQPESRGHGRV